MKKFLQRVLGMVVTIIGFTYKVEIYYLNSLPFEVAGVYQLRLQGFNQSEIQTLLNINELAYERCLKTIKRRLTV